MKILLVTNKTLSRNGVERIDVGYWNFYIPMLQLGHDVRFFDSVNPEEKNFLKIVETFKPDLIFSCITGNQYVTPHENIDLIEKETISGRTKTFNWFCDDTWRFENFSKDVCWKFTACSTPELSYIQKYKEIGYKNILPGSWHTNVELYPKSTVKNIPVSFCGHINQQRRDNLNYLINNNINVANGYGNSYEDMLSLYCSSKIGINFSLNENGQIKKTQMKLRMFEIPAAKSLLFTEYHEGLENYFEIDKEVVVFKEKQEMVEKLKFLLSRDDLISKIASKGYTRITKEHDSKIRLRKLLKEIEQI